MSGARTRAEDQANCTPPHVSASTTAVELAMIMALPLPIDAGQ